MSRYIDSDKLKEELRNGHKQGFFDLPDGVLFEIDDQPTADVRENVRGEWIDKGKKWTITNGYLVMNIPVKECSVCGRPYLYIITDRFCPNCGADMRGDS